MKIFYILKKKASLILFLFFLIPLGSCGPAASSSGNDIKPSDNEQMLLDSITYININHQKISEPIEENRNVFIPVSFVDNGVQLLTGDIGPYSLISEGLLKDMITAESLSELDAKPMYTADSDPYGKEVQGIDSVVTNGTWDIFATEVTYKSYTLENQPDQLEWASYFRQQLDLISSDVPVVIADVWMFTWNGIETAVVTASNALLTGDDNVLHVKGDVHASPNPPLGGHTIMYTISAVFTQGNQPMDLYLQYTEISDESGLSYLVPEDTSEPYQQIFSAIQYDENTGLIDCPIFCDMNGELMIRDFQYRPGFLVCDIDGDGDAEMIENMKRTSSDMCVCKVYTLENDVPVEVLSIVPN